MRISGWFIDRWRKSTAYTDMTAQEQGLYRNLIDEVYLREDGVIPEASLAKASGDPIAWGLSKARVLNWMQKVPGGYTNATAMELKRFSETKAESGKRGGLASGAKREAKREADTQVDAKQKANPDTDAVSVSVQDAVAVPDTANVNGMKQPADLSARGSGLIPGGSCVDRSARLISSPTWNQEACEDWIAAYEGMAPGGRITKALRAIVRKAGEQAMAGRDPRWSAEMLKTEMVAEFERIGWSRVRPVWQAYLRDTNSRFASAEKFAQTFGALEKRQGRAAGGSRLDATRRAFEKFMKEE